MEGTTTAPALESHQHQRNRSTGAPAASSRLPWKDYHRASFGELPPPAMEGTTTAPAPAQPLNGRACFIIAPAMEGTTTAPALKSCHRQPWKERPPAPAPRLNGRACFIIAPALESRQHQHHGSTGVPTSSLVYS